MPMKRKRRFHTCLIMLTSLGLIISGPALQAGAADTASQRQSEGSQGRVPAVIDVALDAGGTLQGQVVDARGEAAPRTPVSIQQLDREVARAVTDASGRFRVTGLRGGTYRIVAGEATGAYRLWAANTAPPAALPSALVVAGDQQLVRGNLGQCIQFLRNPWVVAGLVAVAIAVPVALHNAEKDDESRS
jgi:hypothetical protein